MLHCEWQNLYILLNTVDFIDLCWEINLLPPHEDILSFFLKNKQNASNSCVTKQWLPVQRCSFHTSCQYLSGSKSSQIVRRNEKCIPKMKGRQLATLLFKIVTICDKYGYCSADVINDVNNTLNVGWVFQMITQRPQVAECYNITQFLWL